ncbi:Uncharacterised protein [Mycobacterium tuberculosis]|nr:Uncharacterised protein [Mycobacterium tuberculosis]CNV96256.1 Uncharacterised protein [Mycobacterium tuberculosis]
MAAGIPDAGQTHPLCHVGQVAATEHRDRTARGQLLQCLQGTGGEPGRVGILDNVGQRAVEVEEHRGLPGDQAVGQAECL